MDDDVSLRRLVTSWHRRATVRSDEYHWQAGAGLDRDARDYPTTAVPFWDHPSFQAFDAETQRQVLTLGWIVYNRRTIDAEQYIANPAFGLVFEGRLPGSVTPLVAMAMQQSMVDEHFHSMMHLAAIQGTCDLRGLAVEPRFLPAITYREYETLRLAMAEKWERDLLLFTYALVSEVSINAYLDVLAADVTVQPMHRTIADLHNRDERAHSRILILLAKAMYPHMSSLERRAFLGFLPGALDAFLKQDLLVWKAILQMVGVAEAEADTILGDSRPQDGVDHLSRDYSGLHGVAQELDIIDELEFDFALSTKQAR